MISRLIVRSMLLLQLNPGMCLPPLFFNPDSVAPLFAPCKKLPKPNEKGYAYMGLMNLKNETFKEKVNQNVKV
ncbi:hypothetical protein K469DRAFT_336647 [Zopfia rhizophila CBS 207.26]|uniref:Uncharacterized protein n=1 Tax=Zopfia rhizophila CBS 207.26 TaxID=1314779 RepID=A0A6A6DHD6_9PEZI|nr:hypothetical protein K469DRAFT_336647 [Zopfia rhizophila CBS 207.26]